MQYLGVEVSNGHDVAVAAGAHRQLLPVPLVGLGAVHRVGSRPATSRARSLPLTILSLSNIKQFIESKEAMEKC